MFKVNDTVRVIDPGGTYSTYEAPIEAYAPAYRTFWHKHDVPSNNAICTVIAVSPDQRMPIYIIQDCLSEQVYAISHTGLELASKPTSFEVDDVVIVTHPAHTHNLWENGMRQYAPHYFNAWICGACPEKDSTHTVVALLKQTEISEQLYLIQNPHTEQVYIVNAAAIKAYTNTTPAQPTGVYKNPDAPTFKDIYK